MIEGIPIACVGDKATCPKHQTVATIIAGDPNMQVMGKMAARVNDPLSCGCKLLPKQNLVVQDNGSSSGSKSSKSNTVAAVIAAVSDTFKNEQHSISNNFFEDRDKYENYYIQQYRTDVFIGHKAVILGDEGVSPLDGAVSYFLNYRVDGKALFISVVINAAPLSHKAKVYPFGTVTVSRKGEHIAKVKLTADSGFWPSDKNKAPVGSCTIKLPEPNLQLVDIKLELGYYAVISDTVGSVYPMPPIKKYEFSLNSAARRV
ncbi:PAAR domain-containing protein [Acinetobacter sp. NIPH 2699]|nr:PAAR domain-containing protein [Acinetobacter sp. NIPH 2699]